MLIEPQKLRHSRPPLLAELRHLRARNVVALLHIVFNIVALVGGVLLARKTQGWALYAVSQILVAFAFTHAFVLLHEAGHHTLFRQARLNNLVGHLAGWVALIPYASWRPIHARHHHYTGWQDRDATTAALVTRPMSRWQRGIINFAWRGWLPLFSILYRLQNYWYLPRAMRYLGSAGKPVRMGLNAALMLLGYGVLLSWVGAVQLLWLVGPGLYLALMAQDILLLSQHTHMPTHLSGGENVRPFTPMQQVAFTRSLRLPSWLSRVLLHFDAHELHHMYPAIPGYLLRQVAYTPPNEVSWLTWIRAAKRLSGTDFLFGKREQTGFKI